jgi:hypothetical protein
LVFGGFYKKCGKILISIIIGLLSAVKIITLQSNMNEFSSEDDSFLGCNAV